MSSHSRKIVIGLFILLVVISTILTCSMLPSIPSVDSKSILYTVLIYTAYILFAIIWGCIAVLGIIITNVVFDRSF